MEALTVDAVYGSALFEAARDAGKTDSISEELRTVEKAFKEEPLFFELTATPNLTAAEKKESVRQVFEGRISAELMNFIFVMIDKRRMNRFFGAAKQYRLKIDENKGLSKGIIYSVNRLSDEQRARFETETGKLLGKRVELENKVDA
ncbi:MAG: ATP synthase F1 subunit delta, partial [Clostridiales Family XIII bacterium]|nr:ATP synthase F1 subunit delta [Clostridiales Family XIII bacterium]